MSSQQLIRDVIDSMCYPCTKRLLHFQLFTITTQSAQSSFFWIVEYLEEKKKKDAASEPSGCAVCFGLLEKFSQTPYLTELANSIHASGIQFSDFRISLTIPNNCALREKFIEKVLNDIPTEELPLRIFNPTLSVKEQWKILTFHPLELILGKPYNHTGIFDVKITFKLNDDDLEPDNILLESIKILLMKESLSKRLSRKTKAQKEEQEKGFTKPNVDKIIAETSSAKLKECFKLPLKRLLCETGCECTHDSIYLAGRYLKYSRTLPQTAWLIEGGRRLNSSIEEIMAKVLKKELSATDCVLTASGREDIDVKCLGKGRPFILEFSQPKRTIFTKEELKNYQKMINESSDEMAIRDLQAITIEQTKLIREGQENKSKCYSALCYCYSKLDQNDIEKLNSLKDVNLFQKTPIRVLHRRTVMTRQRWVKEIQAELIDEHHFKLKVTTQAGTYVKEFVHGDLGRTEPSLCTILNKECDILELDVESVNLDFPPNQEEDLNNEPPQKKPMLSIN